MEDGDINEKAPKFWFRNFGWPHVFMILSLIGLGYDLYSTHQDAKIKDKKLAETIASLDKEQEIKTTYVYLTDSLKKENVSLSGYKPLTMAMIHRDEVLTTLKHKVGDIVIMKNDSSKVVIEDLLTGGSKYNYYVKFKVLYKDNTEKEVVPELIY